MPSPFTNAHSHIFTANNAPDYFLKTVIHNTTAAEWVDRLLQKDGTRGVMSGVLKVFGFLSPKKRDIIRRYLEFIQTGTSANQTDVFDALNRSYARYPGHKIIVLTQVLDYLDLSDTTSGHIHIQGQVEEVRGIKQNALYGANIYPFLGLDARQTGLDLLTDWVQRYISRENGFYGIKIYPAAGFFPFDPRLDGIWKWAEENQVPVMTHSTRGGSWYLGTFASLMNSGILQASGLDTAKLPDKNILTRVDNVIADKKIQTNNQLWCNVFGFPDNYEVILRKYPKLKICLAHLGGASEVLRSGTTGGEQTYPAYMNANWYEMIIDLMKRYQNVYSDISYTLSNHDAVKKIVKDFGPPYQMDNFGKRLIDKLLYGTDFYLTQQEQYGDEPDMQNEFLTQFSTEQVQALAYDNPDKYLTSVIWP